MLAVPMLKILIIKKKIILWPANTANLYFAGPFQALRGSFGPCDKRAIYQWWPLSDKRRRWWLLVRVIISRLKYYRTKAGQGNPIQRVGSTSQWLSRDAFCHGSTYPIDSIYPLENTVHWINHYPLGNSIGFGITHRIDSELSPG